MAINFEETKNITYRERSDDGSSLEEDITIDSVQIAG